MTSIVRKAIKILTILLIMQVIFAIWNTSKATGFMDSADDFLDIGRNAASSGTISSQQGDNSTVSIETPTDSELKAIISDIFNVIFPIGVAITVIIGAALGIKFMVASAEDKAKVKESLVPYVVGCVVIYGAFGIWQLAITIFSAIG